MSALTKASSSLKSVDYEVFGRVQGVCFRMYTEEEARKLGVVGWVKNTSQGTVTGQVQGPEDKVNAITEINNQEEILTPPSYARSLLHCFSALQNLRGCVCMVILRNWETLMLKEHFSREYSTSINVVRKSWLSKVGSPSSRIDRTKFSNEKEISKLDFSGFSTRY
uniref:Acylphosphatase n=1 Tax=Gallus gallus TaxID=9031 RepID=A0A8V0YRY8_CHICK